MTPTSKTKSVDQNSMWSMFSGVLVLVIFLLGAVFLLQMNGFNAAHVAAIQQVNTELTEIRGQLNTALAASNPDNNKADETYNIKLFYPKGGNICNSYTMEEVVSAVTISAKPQEKALDKLLAYEFSSEQKTAGLVKPFANAQLSLAQADLVNGVLTIRLKGNEQQTAQQACQTAVLKEQIKKTLEQFAGITEVKYSSDSIIK